MQDGTDRAFVSKELMRITDDTQVPPDWYMEVISPNFCNSFWLQKSCPRLGFKIVIKMSSVMPLIFSAAKLCVITLNDNFWKRAKEVCRALKYQRQVVHVIRDQVGAENYDQKYQLIEFAELDTFVKWPKDSRKDDYYINEEGMYELLFSSQQAKARSFRKHCCNVMFPHVR